MPPEPQPIDRLLAPLREFSHGAASSGVLLLVAALVALLWANSPFAASYDELFNTPLTIGVGSFAVTGTLRRGEGGPERLLPRRRCVSTRRLWLPPLSKQSAGETTPL